MVFLMNKVNRVVRPPEIFIDDFDFSQHLADQGHDKRVRSFLEIRGQGAISE